MTKIEEIKKIAITLANENSLPTNPTMTTGAIEAPQIAKILTEEFGYELYYGKNKIGNVYVSKFGGIIYITVYGVGEFFIESLDEFVNTLATL